MQKPRIAIISFPGSNGETENMNCFRRNGFDPFVFRWNDSIEKLKDVDGYFIGAGFSYEDRGRAGMVAARDPLFQHLHEEAEKGKVIIGHCNGCQVLVESGLIPLGSSLKMSMARNATMEQSSNGAMNWKAPGFLNEWIYMKRTCASDRCASSDWDGVMHIPIAHGEGRFVTKDPELIKELEANDQVAFRYCNADGNVSEDSSVNLNGSTGAIAGICNPVGNVVAMMPHAERSVLGDPYFLSVKRWIEKRRAMSYELSAEKVLTAHRSPLTASSRLQEKPQRSLEIFIDTIIVNNEERTVEQAARRVVPHLKLKQFRYLAPEKKSAEEILGTISLFNPNKEIAYVRNGSMDQSINGSISSSEDSVWFTWNADAKQLESSDSPLSATTLIRRDEPDVGASAIGGGETGVCYCLSDVRERDVQNPDLQEIFGNPHASTLSSGS